MSTTHEAELRLALASAESALLDAAVELLEDVWRHADVKAQWLRFRDAQADVKAAAMALDAHLFAAAAARENARQRGHIRLAEQIIEHPITREVVR